MARRFVAALGAAALGLTVTAQIERSPGLPLEPAGPPAREVAASRRCRLPPRGGLADRRALILRKPSKPDFHCIILRQKMDVRGQPAHGGGQGHG